MTFGFGWLPTVECDSVTVQWMWKMGGEGWGGYNRWKYDLFIMIESNVLCKRKDGTGKIFFSCLWMWANFQLHLSPFIEPFPPSCFPFCFRICLCFDMILFGEPVPVMVKTSMSTKQILSQGTNDVCLFLLFLLFFVHHVKDKWINCCK